MQESLNRWKRSTANRKGKVDLCLLTTTGIVIQVGKRVGFARQRRLLLGETDDAVDFPASSSTHRSSQLRECPFLALSYRKKHRKHHKRMHIVQGQDTKHMFRLYLRKCLWLLLLAMRSFKKNSTIKCMAVACNIVFSSVFMHALNPSVTLKEVGVCFKNVLNWDD